MKNKHFLHFFQRKDRSQDVESQPDEPLYLKIEEFMEESKPYLSCDYTLTDLSLDTCSNKTYTSRAINKMAGENFNNYLNRHRVDYAKSLIAAHPDLTVKEISAMSGFRNVVTFTDAFKKKTGMTPGRYKNLFSRRKGQ